MITIGTKVCVTDITDFILCEGFVQGIKNGKAIIKFPGKHKAYTYDLDDLEEVKATVAKKAKKKQ
jgi:hypothetical protein